MTALLFKRLVSGILSLVAVVVLITSIIYLSPVDPARLTFGQQVDQSSLELKKKRLGLDKPLTTQMYYYLRDISPINFISDQSLSIRQYQNYAVLLSMGNAKLIVKKPYLRESFQTGRSVSESIKQALPNTIILATSAILLASLLGVLFGIIAAIYKDTIWDKGLLAFSTLGYSIPSYVSAIFLAILFGFILKSFTGLNMQGGIRDLNDLGDEVFVPKNLILPALALGVRPISVILQITRSTILETLEKPFVLTAKAKGLSRIQIMKSHVLKNSLNPILTSISGWFASLLSGAFFVESVFRFRGIGQLTINALLNYDIPVLLGCILVVCSFFIIINVLMDLVYVAIDPKLKNT